MCHIKPRRKKSISTLKPNYNVVEYVKKCAILRNCEKRKSNSLILKMVRITNRIKFESDRFAIKHIIIPLSLALVLIYVPMYKMPS